MIKIANPQLENGHTSIANESLEQVYQLKINGTQFRIVMCVWRYTYGFRRKEHKLSETFISKAIQVHKKQVSRELNELIKCNIIKVQKEATFTESRVIAFNKDYDTWYLDSREVTKTLPPNELVNATGSELVGSTGNGLAPQENKYKTNIKQYIDHFNTFWNAYPKKVAKATAEKSFKKLKVDDELLNKMLSVLEIQKQSKQWQTREYIPHPSTWLNNRRWEDEEEIPPSDSYKVKIEDDGAIQL